MDVERAFAICIASMQRAGRLRPGTLTLTPSGAAHERVARERPGFRARMREYRDDLTHRNDSPPVDPLTLLTDRSRDLLEHRVRHGYLDGGEADDPESAAGLVLRAIAAGAVPPLEFRGNGIEGAVFCDASGRAFKVGRRLLHDRRPSLEAEAEWVRVASSVPWVRDHVAHFEAWHPSINVLVRECVNGVKPRWNFDPWSTHREIGQRMRPYGFMLPEFKSDSYALVRGRGAVLLDAGFAVRVGPRVAREALQRLGVSDRTDRMIDAGYLRSEAEGWSRPELARRVASRLDTGRNDAPHAVEWARASWSDPAWGSWGVRLGAPLAGEPLHREAVLFYYQGGGWKRDGHGVWRVDRGRFEGLEKTPRPVLYGLEEALAQVPTVRAAFEAALTEILSDPFRGEERANTTHLWGDMRIAVEAMRVARCAQNKAAGRRQGTDARAKADARAEEFTAIAQAIVRGVCGSLPLDGGCGDALDVIARSGVGDCSRDGRMPMCQHALTPMAAQAVIAETPVGPYDVMEVHRVGEHPCCIYHPQNQARLQLQARVRAEVEARGGTDRQVWNAIRAAEAEHPDGELWKMCDERVRATARGDQHYSGRGSGTEFAELMGLRAALQDEDVERAAPLLAKYRDFFVDRDSAMPDPGDRGLLDVIRQAALDSREGVDLMRAAGVFRDAGVRWESTAKPPRTTGGRRRR